MSTFLGIVTYPHPRYLWLTWFPLFFITCPLWSFRPQGFSARRSWQRCHGIPSGRWLFFESQSILWPRRCQCPSWSFGQSSRGQAVKGEGVWVVQRVLWNLGGDVVVTTGFERNWYTNWKMFGFDKRMMSFLVTICMLPSSIVINWNLHQGL